MHPHPSGPFPKDPFSNGVNLLLSWRACTEALKEAGTKSVRPHLFETQKTVYSEMSFVFEISRKPQLEGAASAQQANKK